MKQILIFLLLLPLWCCASTTDEPQTTEVDNPTEIARYQLVNPEATSSTQNVWRVLCQLYGNKTIAATVARVDWNIVEAERVHTWTGRWPALNVFDFINIHASRDVNPNGWLDYSNIDVVSSWWNAGGLVGCMWHWQVPANNGTDYTCSPGDKPGETSFDPACIDNPESADYKRLVKDLDQVAGYLKQMQRQGIPVIWRPLHEAAGNTYEFNGGKAWFWWGSKGAEVYKRLWRWMYQRLVEHHNLNNLIWVWNSQMGDGDWYPGDDVVDIVGRDSYYALQYPLNQEYQQLSREYPNKLITLAECGNGDEVNMSPWANIWAEGAHWSWFMTWYDYNATDDSEHRFASRQWWQDAMTTGIVVDRDQMKALLQR